MATPLDSIQTPGQNDFETSDRTTWKPKIQPRLRGILP